MGVRIGIGGLKIGSSGVAPWNPQNLVAVVISDTAIDLTWSGGKLAKVERSIDGINFTQIGTGTDSYSDTGLTAGTLYYYQVKGSNYSSIVSDTTFVTALNTILVAHKARVAADGGTILDPTALGYLLNDIYKARGNTLSDILLASYPKFLGYKITGSGISKTYSLTVGMDAINAVAVGRPPLQSDYSAFFDGHVGIGSQLQFTFNSVAQPFSTYFMSTPAPWLPGVATLMGTMIIYNNPATTHYTCGFSLYDGTTLASITVNNWEKALITGVSNGVNSLIQKNKLTAVTGNAGAGGIANLKINSDAQGACFNFNFILQTTIADDATLRGKMQDIFLKYENMSPKIVMDKHFISDGDSMSWINGNPVFASMHQMVCQKLFCNDNKIFTNEFTASVPGHTTVQRQAVYNSVVKPLIVAGKTLMFWWCGVNDFGNYPADSKETIYARFKAYAQTAISDGAIVIPITMCPQSFAPYAGRTDFENEMIWYNNQIQNDLAPIANSLGLFVDLRTIANVGVWGAQDNINYYLADKIHLNLAGQQLVRDLAYIELKKFL